jgi:dCMP deaminase
MENRFKELYMDIAERVAKMSRAEKLKVGSILVKDDRIISLSWNGTPSKWDNICEDEFGQTKPEVIHSEMNCILKLCRSHDSGNNATMFITHAPCIHCAKAIYGAGVTTVYYKTPYRDPSGIEFLKKCGVIIEQITCSCDTSS